MKKLVTLWFSPPRHRSYKIARHGGDNRKTGLGWTIGYKGGMGKVERTDSVRMVKLKK